MENNTQEIWKDIIGYEKVYQVSNLGMVRSLPRKITQKKRTINTKLKILKQRKGGKDKKYFRVGLYRNRKQTHLFVHKLVLEAFIGPRPYGMECCHNNGNNFDNRLKNLRWDTPGGNIADRCAHVGHAGPKSKLTPKQVIKIRQSYDGIFVTQKSLAKKYNVDARTIRRIVNLETWKHL